MIKLKDILFESTAPDIFVPRRVEDRVERYIVVITPSNLQKNKLEPYVMLK